MWAQQTTLWRTLSPRVDEGKAEQPSGNLGTAQAASDHSKTSYLKPDGKHEGEANATQRESQGANPMTRSLKLPESLALTCLSLALSHRGHAWVA